MSTEVREPSAKYVVRSGRRQTDVGMLPDEWYSVKVGDVCDCIVPGRNKPTLFNGKIPWITTPDLENSAAVVTSRLGLCISPEEAKSIGSKVVPIGAILMSCAGELGIVAMTKNEVVVNQQLHVFIPSERIEASFLLNALAYRKPQIESYGTKTAVPYLNKNACNSIQVPLPPLTEQRAISTALSDVDALIAGLEKLIAKKRDLKQAAMQQLLTGQTRLPGFSGAWDYFHVAELEKLGLLKLGRGNVISKKDIDATPGDCPIYSSSVKNDGEFGRYGHFMFDEELITWSVDGGGNFFYRAKHRFSVTNVCGYMRADSKRLNCRYLAAQLQFEHGKKSFDYQSKAHPSVVRAEYLVPIPKHEEQTAIATAISDMDTDLSALEARLAKTRSIKQGMMQELLTGRTRLV